MSDAPGTPPTDGPPTGPWAPSGGRDDTGRTERIDVLAAYFRTNATAYTIEALRRSAADAGYEPRDIDAAMAVSAEPAPIQGTASAVPGLVTIAYLVGTYGLTGVLATIPQTSGLAVVALGLALVLGILAWLMLRDTRPDLANAFRIGVVLAIVVPLVLALVVLGVCLVLLAGWAGLNR